MGTTILSFQNRVVIETLHNEGRSLRYIANYLGFSKTTILRVSIILCTFENPSLYEMLT